MRLFFLYLFFLFVSSFIYGQKNNFNNCFDFSQQQTKHWVSKKTIFNLDVMAIPILAQKKWQHSSLVAFNIGLQRQFYQRWSFGTSIGLLGYDFETPTEVAFCIIPEIRWSINPNLTGFSLGCKSILFDDVASYKTKGGIILPYIAYTTRKNKHYKECSIGGIKYPNNGLYFIYVGLRLGFRVD